MLDIPIIPGMASDVGMRLKRARKLRGLSQVQLAKLAKVGQSSISEVETGESKSHQGVNLVAVASALKISASWLATGKGQMDSLDDPLSPEAIKVAKDWMRLAPEVQKTVAAMIREMVKTSAAEQAPASDEKVAAAYGQPGSKAK